jgi:hypothetical protein
LAVLFEEVVGHEDHGGLGEERFGHRLAADPGLEGVEGQGAVVAPGQDLSVEDGAVGEPVDGAGELGEAVGDEVLAAAPEVVACLPAG